MKPSIERSRQNTFRMFLDFFFAEMTCNETEYDIIENHTISVNTWKTAFRVFEEHDVILKSFRGIQSELFHPTHPKRFLAAYLLGGEITGICRKVGVSDGHAMSVHDRLICPSCLENAHEIPLQKTDTTLFCGTCGNNFPIIDNIIFLFSYQKFQELYPEIFATI